MTENLPFDLPTAHRHFAATCFNAAWELIDKPDRTPAEDEQMLLRTFASFYHWTQRADCTAENRSSDSQSALARASASVRPFPPLWSRRPSFTARTLPRP